ncbi:MAG TPA: NAD-dependent epimerase/dehydratase family protein, partial [Sphingomonas sp.]
MRAVVIGASGGIGAAVVDALREEDAEVHAFARRFEGDGRLDLTDEASVAAAAARVGGEVDLVFIATGLLHDGGRGPEKAMR